ncbi:MAG: FAD-dependent oxidoreductase [Rhodoferax sp.]|nr:FAD-dependent oxidoreductase [Rhodoferax sp.]
MQTASIPIVRDIVLVGGGHSHVGVLRYFAMHPQPGVRLTVVCTDAHTPYSGMLPGYVAGHYSYDEVHIDLCRLCAAIGARFIQAEVTGLDRTARTVLLRDRPALRYDLVSINTGSTPQTNVKGAAEHSVPVKPITGFNQRWLALLARAQTHAGPLRIAIVGGGAGGVELTLAMQHRLRQVVAPTSTLDFALFTAGDLLPTHNPGVRRRFADVLARRGVQVQTHTEVAEVQEGRLRTAQGNWHEADEVLWVTQARGGAWLEGTGLALDAQGCIRLNANLQSISDPLVFSAGDVASLEDQPLEKAGVFAVRMGMPLARNLQRALQQQAAHSVPPATPLAGPDQHRRPLCRGLAWRAGFCGRLGLALERPDRPALYARFFGRGYARRCSPWKRVFLQHLAAPAPTHWA